MSRSSAADDAAPIRSFFRQSPRLLRRRLSAAKRAIIDQMADFEAASGQQVYDADSTIFNQVVYLGCSRIEQPASDAEMLQIVSTLNAEKSDAPIEVVLTVPCTPNGTVKLYDAARQTEMSRYPLYRVRFCARGTADSPDRDCFAFSYTQLNETATECAQHQCHVFRCTAAGAAGKVLFCFASAFRYVPSEPSAPSDDATPPTVDVCAGGDASTTIYSPECSSGAEEDYQFEAFLELKEEDQSKRAFVFCPQEKNCFKLRRGREKRVVVVLRQSSGPRILAVQKCFGLLIAAGRNVRHSDMHLLDMQSMGPGHDSRVYVIEALWDPNSSHFDVLNNETPRETRVFMTVSADVILTGIHDPVRFNIECKARIYHQHERFWYVTRRPVVERYFLTIRRSTEPTGGRSGGGSGEAFEMAHFESSAERERHLSRLSLGRSPTKMASQLVQPAEPDDSDSDEPLLSGSGDVSRECSDELMAEWAECLRLWKVEGRRPKPLSGLIRNGVPDLLRGEVWQLLSGSAADADMMDTYRLLLGKECPSDQMILRDIHRTFPAHDFFKEAGGVGQEGLYKISKAYSLYDEEVGYCQGLSFLAASLLLHMPEEQAFCVLVKLMFDYGLRDLFKLGFDVLHLRFYQLERLIQDYIPDLYQHFEDLHLETHMYASQWFLTLFTAKFPLQMVFIIIDLFLSEGMNTIFHISLALLRASKKELLQLDFESALKYFRVFLPRKYRTEQESKELIMQAVRLRISHKRLSKYEKEYIALKQREVESQDPLERLEKENLRLKETTLRLERENDDLAHELVTSKIELRQNLDAAEDQLENVQAMLERAVRSNTDLQDENKHLHAEYEQVKDMCRRELHRVEQDACRAQKILVNYKQICSDLSTRLERQQTNYAAERKLLKLRVQSCDRCCDVFESTGTETPLSPNGGGGDDGDAESAAAREEHIRQLELELAQAKLALVEAQCRNQDLNHQMNSAQFDADDGPRSTWIKKTLSTLKGAAANAAAARQPPPPPPPPPPQNSNGGGHSRKDSSSKESTASST